MCIASKNMVPPTHDNKIIKMLTLKYTIILNTILCKEKLTELETKVASSENSNKILSACKF